LTVDLGEQPFSELAGALCRQAKAMDAPVIAAQADHHRVVARPAEAVPVGLDHPGAALTLKPVGQKQSFVGHGVGHGGLGVVGGPPGSLRMLPGGGLPPPFTSGADRTIGAVGWWLVPVVGWQAVEARPRRPRSLATG